MSPEETKYAERWLAMRKETLKLRGLLDDAVLPDLSGWPRLKLEMLLTDENIRLEVSKVIGDQN